MRGAKLRSGCCRGISGEKISTITSRQIDALYLRELEGKGILELGISGNAIL
jgi:hypothetical protein